jgi:hypothetical protein
MKIFLLLLVFPQLAIAAGASSPLADFEVSGTGSTTRACEAGTKAVALDKAWRTSLARERISGDFAACMQKGAPGAVSVERVGQTIRDRPESCTLVYSGRYDAGAIRKAAPQCARTAIPIPVGVIFRAEVNGEAQESSARTATAGIGGALGRANFTGVNLEEFEDRFRKQIFEGDCAITGDVTLTSQEEKARCSTRAESYAEAIRQLSDVLQESIKVYRASDAGLENWGRCGATVIIGQLRFEEVGQELSGQVDVTYRNVLDVASTIQSFKDTRRTAIDLGGRDAAINKLTARFAEAAAADAVQKLVSFAHSRGCTPQ